MLDLPQTTTRLAVLAESGANPSHASLAAEITGLRALLQEIATVATNGNVPPIKRLATILTTMAENEHYTLKEMSNVS